MEETRLLRPLVRPVVVLVAFYNKKALGVRYLETALEGAGYVVHTIFYKDFNSVRPTPTTQTELELLRREVSPESQAWFEMIYCWQFPLLRPWLRRWEEAPPAHAPALRRCCALARQLGRLRYLRKKGGVVLLRLQMG